VHKTGLFVVAVGLLVGCSIINEEEAPTDPTPVTQPSNPIVVPVILPSLVPNPPPTIAPPTGGPNPGPTPTPTPNPNPDPNPTPTPPPTTQAPNPGSRPRNDGCGLPPQSPNVSCSYGSPRFVSEVEAALDEVIRRHPGYFDLGDQRGSNSPRVLNDPGYLSALVNILAERGFCALWDGEEIAIKDSNSYNEQYDTITSTGYMRRHPGAYRSTCSPAWF